MTAPIAHINARRASAAALLALASLVPFHPTTAEETHLSVHAERQGLRIGTNALSGRVDLIASGLGDASVRARVVGVGGWRLPEGRILIRDWETTTVPDGRYVLEIAAGGRVSAQTLYVRNRTPLPISEHEEEEEDEEGNASGGLSQAAADARSIVAGFRRQSYKPGQTAELVFWGRYASVKLELLRSGPETITTVGNETMHGVAVTPRRRLVRPRTVRIVVGNWPSGLYLARLTASRGRVGYAPFVVAPKRLGGHRVAVVQPTNTWQAYNFRDGNRDGRPDSWYRNGHSQAVSVSRPYLDRGVPPHFRQYDLAFIHWLHRRGKEVDMLAQEDIERVSGDRLARLYDLIVFPGHHEYVTEREYDAVERYRDLGGNLAFLSANNFFWRVDRRGHHLHRIAMYRDIGRPEARLVGIQYFDWNHGVYGSEPYRIVGARRAPWLFAGTGLTQGDAFGQFGIEADGRTAASPRGIRVLARLDDAFGTGQPAEMTSYTTRAGAKVFAAGAFTLAGRQARTVVVRRFLENLWRELSTA
jgi:hypothetical protein